jgi:hypothetical protein
MMERVLSWALALTLAVLLLVVVIQAQSGPSIFGIVALRSGIGFVEPYGRYVAIVLQLLAVVLVVIPKTRSRGSMLALVLTLGAVLTHLSPWLGIQLPLQGPALTAALQNHDAAAIAALPSDKGGMFMLALAIAILAAANIFVERAKIRAAERSKHKRPVGAFADA